MKNIILLFVFFNVLVSCHKKPIVVETAKEKTETKEVVSKVCYMGILKKDTVSMTLELKENNVSGKLTYNNFEKDKNTGTIKGVMKGDSLIAEYSFMSEGMGSIRQVVFLKKGNAFIEGYGDTTDDNNGKVVFKDIKKLKFDNKIILTEVMCN